MSHQLTFGEYIRRQRKTLKITLGDLAEKVGVSYTYMSKIENDQQLPSEKTVFRIANVLETPVMELMGLSKRLPSDIMRRLLEEQAKPSLTVQRNSGSPVSEEERAQAIINNVPTELVTALANFFNLDANEPDMQEMVNCIQALAHVESDKRTMLVNVIAKLAEEDKFKIHNESSTGGED